MEYIYFLTTNEDTVDNYELAKMARIINGYKLNAEDLDEVRCYAESCRGIVKEINPSVKHLVKNGRKLKAIMVYSRRHPDISFADCKKIIEKIEESFKKE